MSKKSFKNSNPALAFISSENDIDSIKEKDKEAIASKPRLTPNLEMLEVKSDRKQLMLRPSTHKKIKQLAKKNKKSFNDYVHRVLDEHLLIEENKSNI